MFYSNFWKIQNERKLKARRIKKRLIKEKFKKNEIIVCMSDINVSIDEDELKAEITKTEWSHRRPTFNRNQMTTV